jgi:hypothetical protein
MTEVDRESAAMRLYLIGAGVVAIGIVLAVIDWRRIGWPLFGGLLVLGIAGGFVTTQVSPFTFAGGDYYFQGLIISVGSALALAGYIPATIWHFARRWLGKHGGR